MLCYVLPNHKYAITFSSYLRTPPPPPHTQNQIKICVYQYFDLVFNTWIFGLAIRYLMASHNTFRVNESTHGHTIRVIHHRLSKYDPWFCTERRLLREMTTVFIRVVTVYPKKYAQGFVVLCFVVVMQSFIMNSHEVFIHIHQGCFAGTGAIVRLPQCQWSKPGAYGKISQCITTTKHSKAKTVCIFLGIYCTWCWLFNHQILLLYDFHKV